MPPDKVKLSPESKRTFLEIALKHAVDKQESASEEQLKSLLYSFAKKLCISKFYLYCSYPIDPGFYRLNLKFEQNPNGILVSLASKDYNFSGKNKVSLTYDSVYKLIKLLLPSYVGAAFFGKIIDASVFEQYLKILKLTKGRIGLQFDWRLKREFVQTLLKTFASRTYVLDCDMDHFEAVELLQFPVFDYLCVCDIENAGQILRVLKCKAKELELIFFENFTINDSDLVNLKNETVEKLYLEFNIRVNQVNIEKLVEQLHKCYSSLKHLHINLNFQDNHGEVSVNQVPDRVIDTVKRLDNLKAYIENGLASMYIDFYVWIHLNGRRDNSWKKAISDKIELKHWKPESDTEVYRSFVDTLVMKLDDARCKLKMTIHVFNRNVENENQASEDDVTENEDMDADE